MARTFWTRNRRRRIIRCSSCRTSSARRTLRSRTYESVVRQATTSVKNLILAMNGEKPIAQVNPEVPVKKVI